MDWLDLIATVARISGLEALRHFRTALVVAAKSDGSPVTVADRSAEHAARDWIARNFPGDAIIGEELGTSSPPNATRTWLIDPIDGTKAFIHGVPLWGAMIAVMERATVLGGAVFCPAVDEIVVAALERGCWHNGARCAVSSVASLADATILTTSDRFPEQPARRTRWQALAQRAGIVRTWGDCFGYVLVATGRAEAMVDNSLHLWDYSPLVPIISEAGGTITNWRGTVDFAGDAIATNRALATDVRAVLLDPRAA